MFIEILQKIKKYFAHSARKSVFFFITSKGQRHEIYHHKRILVTGLVFSKSGKAIKSNSNFSESQTRMEVSLKILIKS